METWMLFLDQLDQREKADVGRVHPEGHGGNPDHGGGARLLGAAPGASSSGSSSPRIAGSAKATSSNSDLFVFIDRPSLSEVIRTKPWHHRGEIRVTRFPIFPTA